MEIIINNEAETYEYGRRLAEQAKPGQVVALIGDLGTGKTTLTKAIAEGLHITEPVSSPTFSIIKEYEGGIMPLYHFDVYRLGGVEDLYDLGYEEYFFGNGITVVEWADKIEELLPKNTIRIEIEYGKEPDSRTYRRL
jgi:tRNA threonylcarbamoyladenosine biosynthesis protein TsaE